MGYAGYGNNSQQDSNQNEKTAETPDREAAKRPPDDGKDRPGFDLGGAKDAGGKGTLDQPAAGPHAEPSLTNQDATPGTGALPEAGDPDATDSTTG